MKVVIPLAGYGTRLRPHTYTKPKPLINVAGQPVLGHILDKLQGLDISEYIFIVGYLGDQIAEYIDENYDFPAKYVSQHEMLGQSHAIYLAREYIDTEEPVFVIFGDHIFESEFELVKNPIADAVIYVKEVDDPRKYGVVMLNNAGYIVDFVEKAEKPPTNLAIIGMYYINSGKKLVEALARQIEEDKKTKGEYFIADALQYLVEGGMRFVVERVTSWLDCGNPDAVLKANRHLLNEGGLDNSNQVKFDNVIIVPPVRIHPSSKIKYSVIGPNVTVGPDCNISWSIVRESIVGDGSDIQNTVLEDSLIGMNAAVVGQYTSFNVGDSSSVGFKHRDR
jgi:glucose-1-phosphate thymidylyltransferase